MEDSEKVKALLETAVQIERKAGAIYRHFHTRFQGDKMTGYLWHSLAVEEEGHAEFIEAEIKMFEKVPSAFGEITLTISELHATLKTMEEIEARVAVEEISLKDAVCISLKIERELVEAKYNRIIDVSSPGLKRIFSKLTNESDHHEKIAIVASKLGVTCE